MRIAVAGGTGMVGTRVVARLEAAGHQPVVLARAHGIDILAGAGLSEALQGVDALIDVTSIQSQKAGPCVEFFGGIARQLQLAGADAGVGRIVTLSIVGIDQMSGRGHYAGKLAQEAATRAGSVPWSILRATQFHDFGRQLTEWIPGPVVPVPGQLVQTVDIDTVVTHLLRLAEGAGAGETMELGGPQQLTMLEQVRRTLKAMGSRRLALPIWLPGAAEAAARRGAALPGPGAVIEGTSFDEWVAELRPSAG